MEEIKTVIDNTKDWYDLVDTTLKIGLGALIAGIFSFLTLKSNQKHELSKEKFKQKSQILMSTNNDFNIISNSIYNYLDFHISMLMHGYDNTKNLQTKDKEKYEEIEKEYIKANNKFPTIKSNLNLLGIEEIKTIIQKYDEKISRYRQYLVKNDYFLIEKIAIEKILDELLFLEESYNKIISKYYENLK